VREFLNLGLTFAIRYLEDMRESFMKLFVEYDVDEDGLLNFEEFSRLLYRLDSNIKQWKILAVFQGVTGKESGYQHCKVKFEQFLFAAVSNDLMAGLVSDKVE